ncbi:MAG: phosphopyruvate hydratase [Candidatus Diapherotrites archaeon]|nr:phosphopyruvate hydratase [Candidatus Diapherotrites archaeon]
MAIIDKIHARQVLDSRGNPTVEVEVWNGKDSAKAIVPSGASTGSFEALELRDGGKEFNGKSVLKAVKNVNEIIAPKLKGLNFEEQKQIDELMLKLDGTENKSKLGANAILGVSLAVCKLTAQKNAIPLYEHIAHLFGQKKVCLPVPMLNVLNGGKHAGQENDVQETMIMPLHAKTFSEGLRYSVEVYHALGKELKKKFGWQSVLLGDEGGFAPPIKTQQERLELLEKVLEELGLKDKFVFALDPASSEFFKNGNYFVGSKKFSSAEMVDYWKELGTTFPLWSLEDGMAEEDWAGWQLLNKTLGGKMQLVGDDLLVTNTERIEKAIQQKACNALLLKVNQIGTLTESFASAKKSFDAGWNVIVSHRSGETEDTFIADLAVGLGCGQSKFGAPARSDRNAKYNQLLRIEEQLGTKAVYGRK